MTKPDLLESIARGKFEESQLTTHSFALHGVTLDDALPEVLHIDRRHLRRTRSAGLGHGELWNRHMRQRRMRHGDDARLFLGVIEQDGLPGRRVGDDAGIAAIDARLAIARPQQFPRSLLRRGTRLGALNDTQAIGAGGGQGRRHAR